MTTNGSVFQRALSNMPAEIFDGPPARERICSTLVIPACKSGSSSPLARVGTTWALPSLSPPLLTRPITSWPSGKSLRG